MAPAGAINFNHTSADYVFAPAISGAGSVNVLAGVTILTANSTYAGGTTISGRHAATRQRRRRPARSSAMSTDNGTLAFDRSDNVTFPGVISGNGSLASRPRRDQPVRRQHLYRRDDDRAGALQLGIGGASGLIVGDVVDNGALAFNRTETVTFAGMIRAAAQCHAIGAGRQS